MRVAVVGPVFPFKGGVAAHTTVLAARLAADRHDVTVFSWRRQYPSRLYPGQQETEHREFPESVPVVRSLCWNRPDTWLRTGRTLRRFDLVVIAHTSPFQVPAYWCIVRSLGRVRPRIVLICHNVLPHERHPADKRLVASLLRCADQIVVHSREQGSVARGLTTRPVATVDLPTHVPAIFAPSPQGGVHRRLLFFGLIRPYKGVDVLLRALAISDNDIKVRIAGEAWGGIDELQKLIIQLGLSERVELIPEYVPAPAVPRVFADVDAMVMPYREATGSQGVAVAFQLGVPVIVTRVGSLAEQVSDGINGLIVAPDDVGSLAEAIARFYEDGVADALRAAVRPISDEAAWRLYLQRIVGHSVSRQTEPS